MQASIAQRQSDMVLVERFQYNGDELAFAELVRRYTDHVYSTCLRVLGDPSLAEDATQETFFKLFKQPQQVRQSVGGWLHRVATRLAIDRIRRDARRRHREQAYYRLEEARQPAAEARTWDELAPHIDAALDALPDDAREILVAHFLHNRALTELAIEREVSKATMSRRCREALEKLRSQLRRRGVVAGAAALGTLLAEHTVTAAPATVTRGLGRMALAGGAAPAATGGGVTVHVTWQAVAAMALLLTTLIAAGVLLRLTMPPPHRTTGDDVPARPAAVAPPAPAPTYLALPGAGDHLASDAISLFQHPESAIGGRIAVVFGDGRVITMSLHEARPRIEQQTGRTLEELLQTLPAARP